MRLSDIKGERTLDVIADIVEPISNIASDKAAVDLFSRKAVPAGMDARAFVFERVKKSVPALLKGHKADVIAVLAAIDGVSREEYTQSLTLIKLTTDCIELLTDEAFTALFISTQSERSSGSVLENTGDLQA